LGAYAPEAPPPWAEKATVLSVELWRQLVIKHNIYYVTIDKKASLRAALQRTLRGMISSNHMKKISRILANLAVVTLMVLPQVVVAADYGLNAAAEKANYTTGGSSTIYSWVQIVITVFLSALAFVFFGYVLYAGVMWMLARGNEEKITESKSTIEAAIVGLVIVMAAYAITTFVFKQLGQ
jgi:hypothetical protein